MDLFTYVLILAQWHMCVSSVDKPKLETTVSVLNLRIVYLKVTKMGERLR